MKRRASTVRRAPPTAAKQPAPLASFEPPYPPSWFDRVMAMVDRLPGPYALWYGLASVGLFLLISLARLAAGMAPLGGDLAQRALAAFGIVFPPFLMHSLNRSAARALASFRPVLSTTEAETGVLAYRLTTAPAAPALAFSLGGAGLGLLLVLSPEVAPYLESFYGPFAAALALGALGWFVNSHFAYRTIYQLTLVSRIYRQHAAVRLFDLGPFFALSHFTSRAAIAAALTLSVYMLGFAEIGDAGLAIAVFVPNFLLAASAFVLPLLGAHRQLVVERDRWVRQASLQMETAVSALHRTVESGKFAQAPALKDAVTGLDIELNRLARVPTWPWNPGTPRGVAAAIFLPVFIWLIQFGLQRLLQ